MKITKENQVILIIKDNIIFALIIFLLFFLIGILTLIKPSVFAETPPKWFGVVWISIVCISILAIKTTTITLDKQSNKLRIVKKGIIDKDIKEYALDQIEEVELSQVYYASRSYRGYSYLLAFIFKNGENIQLNSGKRSITRIMGKQIIPEISIGKRIANFLNVPFRERRPPTVTETLTAVSSSVKDSIKKEIDKRNLV